MLVIANTDHSWFSFHRGNPSSAPINFWTPTPWSLHRLKRGDRVYFMRKAPIRKIGGFGIFREYLETTPNEAWRLWGVGNGSSTFEEFLSKISSYAELRSISGAVTSDSQIGNIILENPIFFEADNYIDLDKTEISFPRQIVKFKYFPLESEIPITGRTRITNQGTTTGPAPRSRGYIVEPKDPNVARSFTYIARYGNTQVYKIGYSENPENRQRELNEHIPTSELGLSRWEMIYLCERSSTGAQALEQEILTKRLDKFRTERERVYCGSKVIDKLAEELHFVPVR